MNMMNNNFIQQFQQFMKNPSQFMMQNFGINQNIANDPDAIINQMMREGRISQNQYNSARQMAQQMRNNPMFSNFFKK